MSDTNERSVASAGSVASEPVAWAVNHAHGTTLWDTEAKARKIADEWLASGIWVWAEVVPLYRQPQPTLTDAERSAIKEASEFYIGTRTGVALGGLLGRLK